MVTLGVVLLIAAVLLGVDLVLENSGTTDVMIMGQMLSFDVWGLFVLGVASGVLAVAGAQLLAAGLVKDRQKAKARRQAERAGAGAGAGATAPTVPQPPIQGGPLHAPPAGPATAPQPVAPADAPTAPPVNRPSPGPFDRVVARKRDKPDQPTAAV